MNGIQPFNNFGQTPLVFIYLHKYKRLACVFYFSTGINRILEPIMLGYHADAQPITTVCCNPNQSSQVMADKSYGYYVIFAPVGSNN